MTDHNLQPGRPLPDIRQTRIINAPIALVWEKTATSEGIASWFMPNTFTPEQGAEFVLHAGPFGDSKCKVTELSPPRRLSFAWGEQWSITFELRELEPDVTEFTLIHSGWLEEGRTEFGQPHSQVRGNMNGGWEKIVQKLAGLFAS
ncbi:MULTISPECIES: SRPBCC domain-containing protein [unclassified Paenibacillus]|uniref:SRPBCC family protein n=1 Tax=unclassified Paenibacillus TaxID=185978 RepID=UPI000953BE74|nr:MULTISPECIES: SRPBCC domain-containing protein [unclassified Paenibacillus]ASS68396.1 SRPBCC domain-containing protein [Paenibacillus sp. RUD330]SIR31920.1 Uncharacterized conserved protein YndB, AHSA1/START domain [Paenibacillus sp. RU4X]SIR43248.1 Uncharacterized conserved protein YndB, AHSA1/START domain [Paenibacillus sp. RU4T]